MGALMIHPRDIQDEEMYYIVNRSRHHVTFHVGHIHGDENYNWKGPNDPDSTGDVRIAVPGSVVKQRAFQMMLAKGVVEFEDADSYYASIQSEASVEWDDDTSILDSIDRSAQDGFEFLSCLGPKPKGSNQENCGEQVIVRASQVGERPPLCDRHERYAKFFSYTPGEGWSRIK